MSSEWITSTVGEFCPFKYGKGLPERARVTGLFPVMSSAGVVANHIEPLVKSPGIVIGRKGTAGSVTFAPGPFWPIDTAFYVEDDPGNRDIRFTYYLLKTLGLSEMNSDSAVPGLNRDNAHAVAVRIPPLGVQAEIASFLGAIDERITLLRETNATLEAIAQALFKSWFVDFDPVRAKMEGRAPEGMDEATAALFPDSFEETELGVVPRGWSWGTLSDLATFQNGYAFKSKDWADGGHQVVKIGDVKPGIINLEGCSYVAYETVVGLDRFRLSRGDLLVGMTGYVGETGLVPSVEPAAYLNQRVGRMATKSGVADLGYLYCAARSPAFKEFAESQSHGSAQANVSGASLMAFPAVIAPLPLMERFNGAIADMLEVILTNHEKARTLSTVRDTLLPRLISGQLHVGKVSEVEHA